MDQTRPLEVTRITLGKQDSPQTSTCIPVATWQQGQWASTETPRCSQTLDPDGTFRGSMSVDITMTPDPQMVWQAMEISMGLRSILVPEPLHGFRFQQRLPTFAWSSVVTWATNTTWVPSWSQPGREQATMGMAGLPRCWFFYWMTNLGPWNYLYLPVFSLYDCYACLNIVYPLSFRVLWNWFVSWGSWDWQDEFFQIYVTPLESPAGYVSVHRKSLHSSNCLTFLNSSSCLANISPSEKICNS